MSRVGTELAVTALGALEAGMQGGAVPEAGALAGLIAGLSALSDREPSDNERRAITNLTAMLFLDPVPVGLPADGAKEAAPSTDEAARN